MCFKARLVTRNSIRSFCVDGIDCTLSSLNIRLLIQSKAALDLDPCEASSHCGSATGKDNTSRFFWPVSSNAGPDTVRNELPQLLVRAQKALNAWRVKIRRSRSAEMGKKFLMNGVQHAERDQACLVGC